MDSEHTEPQELPLDTVGMQLRRAREAAGMTVKSVADATRIPFRHIEAIEGDDFAALPARAYAVGFARTIARAVGVDEAAIIAAVREQLATSEPAPRRAAQPFEPGDPARVPSARFAWVLALLALAVIFAGFAFWRTYYEPGGELPSLLPAQTAAPVAPPPPTAATPAPTPPPSSGPVVFTATAPKVWVKFSDGAGKTLLQKEMEQGEQFTVPVDAPQAVLWTGRPDALAITIGGQPVPPLADHEGIVRDVPVSAAALLARRAVPAPSSGTAALAPPAERAARPPAPVSPAPKSTSPAAPINLLPSTPAADR